MGKLEIVNLEGSDVDINGRSYEKEVKEHMLKKINELVSLLQYADSQAVHFHNEVDYLYSKLFVHQSIILIILYTGKGNAISAYYIM